MAASQRSSHPQLAVSSMAMGPVLMASHKLPLVRSSKPKRYLTIHPSITHVGRGVFVCVWLLTW